MRASPGLTATLPALQGRLSQVQQNAEVIFIFSLQALYREASISQLCDEAPGTTQGFHFCAAHCSGQQ